MKEKLKRFLRIDTNAKLYLVAFLLFICSTIIRGIIADFDKSILTYNDELIYYDMARNIAHIGKPYVHNVDMNFYQIFYPLLLSPFTLIKNVQLQLSVIAYFNAFLMSSSVFPVIILAKKITNHNYLALLSGLFILLLPDFLYSITYMSENLFYPLCAWIFLLIWEFINSSKDTIRLILSFSIGIGMFVLYITKIVALCLTIAFIIVIVYDFVFTNKSTKKQNIKYAISFLITFIVLKSAFSFFYGAPNVYTIRSFDITNFSNIYFLIYAAIYNGIFALIAFFYFPIMFPFFKFRYLGKNDKLFLVFSFSALIVTICVTTYSYSTTESFYEKFTRQHLRYFSPLLIMFFIMFIKTLKEHCNFKHDKFYYPSIYIITTALVVIIFACLGFAGDQSPVDGMLMKAYVIEAGNRIGSVPGLHRNSVYGNLIYDPFILGIKCLISILIIGFSIAFHQKSSKIIRASGCTFVGVAVAISLINNYAGIELFQNLYWKHPANIIETSKVGEVVNTLEGNVGIICNGAAHPDNMNRLIDTYIYRPNMNYLDSKTITFLAEANPNGIVLSDNPLTAMLPYKNYKVNIENLDYILTDNSVVLRENSAEIIPIEGVSNYTLYKNFDSSKLYPAASPFFPTETDRTKIVSGNSPIFSTQQQRNVDGYYISENSNGALIYGPYVSAAAGVYDITFTLELEDASITNEVIATCDVYNTAFGSLGKGEFLAQEENLTLKNVTFSEDTSGVEIRIFPKFPNIVFKQVSITRVDDYKAIDL